MVKITININGHLAWRSETVISSNISSRLIINIMKNQGLILVKDTTTTRVSLKINSIL
jgi:hypothetical protein